MRSTLFVGALLFTILAGHSLATAQTITFTKVADTDTPIPGGTGTFVGFGAASISGENVVFRHDPSPSVGGIYIDIAGTLDVVADASTPIPGGTGNFGSFGDPSISGTNVAFRGGEVDISEGIYIDVGGTLDVVADTSTPIPGGTGNFNAFGEPSISGENVAFRHNPGVLPGSGIFIDVAGTLDVVADTSTPIAGAPSSTFFRFGDPSVSGLYVTFNGGVNFGSGVYLDDDGTLDVVADLSTPMPGGTTIIGFEDPSVDGSGNVSFRTVPGALGTLGIFADLGGTLTLVADQSTPMPGTENTFFYFGPFPSIDGGKVAFTGGDSFQSSTTTAVFLYEDDALSRIIGVGDELDGKTIVGVDLGTSGSAPLEALDGDKIAFRALFDDSEGIYVATVPEPHAALAGICAMAVVALVAVARRRSTRNSVG
jgi:hypothetical protein